LSYSREFFALKLTRWFHCDLPAIAVEVDNEIVANCFEQSGNVRFFMLGIPATAKGFPALSLDRSFILSSSVASHRRSP
jgi:hypothetical protein